jgi:hypothetical protein
LGRSAEELEPLQVVQAAKVCHDKFFPIPPSEILTKPRSQQSEYAGDILFLAAHCLAKASVVLLLMRLTRTKDYLFICYGLLGATLTWGVAAILAVALRCDLISPWLSHQCAHIVSTLCVLARVITLLTIESVLALAARHSL